MVQGGLDVEATYSLIMSSRRSRSSGGMLGVSITDTTDLLAAVWPGTLFGTREMLRVAESRFVGRRRCECAKARLVVARN